MKVCRRSRLGMCLALAAFVGLPACGTPLSSGDEDEAVIGAFVPITGPLAPLGTDMRNGYRLAVEEYGEVNGRPIKLEVADSQATPLEGLVKSRALVEAQGADVLIGGASSSVVLALMEQGKRMEVPLVTTNGQSPDITGASCNRYTFRTNPDDVMAANSTERMMERWPKLKKDDWYVVYHDQVWGKGNKAAFEAIDGVNVIGSSGRPFGTADWSSVIQDIQSEDPDAIYLALAVGDDIPSFVRQARSFGLKQKMLLPIGAPDTMLRSLGEDGVGLLASGLHASWRVGNESSDMATFARAYNERYGEPPGLQAITAYAGMTLTLTALDDANSLDTDSIIRSMESAEADTVLGHLSVRKQDHQVTASTWSAVVEKQEHSDFGEQYSWKPLMKNSWSQIKTSPTDCDMGE